MLPEFLLNGGCSNICYGKPGRAILKKKPLLTIQQFALAKVRNIEEQLVQPPVKAQYEKLAMRCSFGIINAGRNSA